MAYIRGMMGYNKNSLSRPAAIIRPVHKTPVSR